MRYLPRNALLGQGVLPLQANDRKSRAEPTLRPGNALQVVAGPVTYEMGPITSRRFGSAWILLQEDIAEITCRDGSHSHELLMELLR
jgi:hypothetical protein